MAARKSTQTPSGKRGRAPQPRRQRQRHAQAHATKAKQTGTTKRWSHQVMEHSDALDLEHGVFAQEDPKKIAASLKRSAEHSARRKAGAYRSALSMLTFYINRAGRTLPKTQRERLERAKGELKRQFGRE